MTSVTDEQRANGGVIAQHVCISSVRAARIVELRDDALRSEYSWYASWTTGCESIYALLCKFAWINCLSAREVAKLVVSSRCGRKERILQQLDVDLREPDVFDVSKIARLCHTDPLAVNAGFVRGTYTQRLAETYSDLRYCPQCLEQGFHSALFQLVSVRRCPLHHSALQQQCGQCAALIPYRLSASLLRKPFACPRCAECFAPALYEGPRRDLRMSAKSRSVLAQALDFAGAKTRLRAGLKLDKHVSLYGRGRLVLGAPSMQRSQEEYDEFIDAILQSLMGDLRSPLVQPIMTDEVDPIAPVIQIVRGHDLPRPRIQPWRVLAARRSPSAGACIPAPKGANHARKSQVPLPGSTHSPGPRAASKSRAEQKLLAQLSSSGDDTKLQAIYPIYQAVRRHIFRQVLSAHRSCIRSAAARLSWDVEGALIVRFCPAAEAFLRWRMFWEGFGVPDDLFRKPRHVAFGLRAWLCEGAPICAEGWTAQGEQWLTHRVFAMQCVRHFYEWWSYCESTQGDRPQRWLRTDVIGNSLTYWAALGSDTPREPLRVFLDTKYQPTVARNGQSYPHSHLIWHLRQLVRVIR
jgi:hypothetical protein